MFLIRPRPYPPLPIYESDEQERLQQKYELELSAWHRETSVTMFSCSILVVCASVAMIVAGFVVPGMVVDAFTIFAKGT